MKFKHGFSLTELLIVIAIIMILASMIAINMDSYKQTAKQEAEKLAGYIHDLMRKADRSHRGFEITFDDSKIQWAWTDDTNNKKTIYKKNPNDTDKPLISPGFEVEGNFSDKVTYKTDSRFCKEGHFTVTRKEDASKYYVYIFNGRIRISPRPNEK